MDIEVHNHSALERDVIISPHFKETARPLLIQTPSGSEFSPFQMHTETEFNAQLWTREISRSCSREHASSKAFDLVAGVRRARVLTSSIYYGKWINWADLNSWKAMEAARRVINESCYDTPPWSGPIRHVLKTNGRGLPRMFPALSRWKVPCTKVVGKDLASSLRNSSTRRPTM